MSKTCGQCYEMCKTCVQCSETHKTCMTCKMHKGCVFEKGLAYAGCNWWWFKKAGAV
jgi:hypothetical protein